MFLMFSAISIPFLSLFVAIMATFSTHRKSMRRFRRAISLYGKAVLLLASTLVRIRYEDRAGATPPGPYIFVCNHRSMSDPFLMSLLPVEAVQVVNIWPFRIPVLGFYARMAGYLSVKEMPNEEFFERAMRLLDEGVSIIFFPEGTRSGSGEMGNFHSAAFHLFLESRVPIVPVCISGNENIPKRGSLLLQEGEIVVRIMPEVRWEDNRDSKAYNVKTAVRDMMMGELKLMDEGARAA